ncbi:FAR1-related sequence 5-like protein [Tanacetum coccineum]
MLDMIPNGVYRAELKVETIINKMREGRLGWFRHVKRRPQSTPVRRVKALVVDGSRRRGRPKLRVHNADEPSGSAVNPAAFQQQHCLDYSGFLALSHAAESDDMHEREGNSQGFKVQPKVEPLEMVLNPRAAADLVEQKTVMRQVLRQRLEEDMLLRGQKPILEGGRRRDSVLKMERRGLCLVAAGFCIAALTYAAGFCNYGYQDLDLKNMDDNQLNEANLVVDAENNLVDTEIQEVDGLIVYIGEEENLVAATIKSHVILKGVPKYININTLDLENSNKQARNTRHRITGCKARIKVDLDLVFGKYEITKFVSKHTHQMIPKHYKHLTKKQRKMTQAEKMFVVKASTMKLGATRAHNLYSNMKGGAQYVHGTSDDFKNHIRDVNAFIGESDVQMLINKMENRKKFVPNFTFQYKVENTELVALFWAAKYDMVFVPFIEMDNHKKCVTFDSGLLLREDTEAYTWLLRSFMTAHEQQLTMIVTDQDGEMKLAIEEICKEIYDETDFNERFNKIVWNMFMEPMEFEEKWSKLIEDFGLQNHKWVTKMFNLREMWLHAYFIDSLLFGLMRTTSRSESENAFFKSFTNHRSTLVNFMMCFESAMERQRKIFLLVKKEIVEAVWACQIQECKTKEGCDMVKVLRSLEVDSVECTYEEMLAKFVEQLKTIKQEVQFKVPKPPLQKIGDVIEDIYAVEKPQQNNVNNPQRAVNKGGRRGERRKSGREMALKAKTKQIRKSATEQATTTEIVSEEATNAS